MKRKQAAGRPAIILASTSPRRAQLMREIGYPFRVSAVNVEEVAPTHLSPAETAMINAHRKAHAAARRYPGKLVLGADTVVSLGRQLLGKPADRAEAERMLARLQGKTHHVITGICLLHSRTHRQRLFAVHTAVTFRRLNRLRIREYLAKINPLDKAGGYAIQEEGARLVKAIQGPFSNVVGLPVERLREELDLWS
ncbi:MAG TPA: Maf family protein [Verrucomicrobiae bacterium]|jgi:septum formation protein|nr:Maf family protein [Verrucomicrobiae bacterium]